MMSTGIHSIFLNKTKLFYKYKKKNKDFFSQTEIKKRMKIFFTSGKLDFIMKK